ncbi:MAG: uracil-DNA glycosylase, partial [Proteobacteria bacterium]|nr:uracil-DNA glycosylase [Pseudomonadota bacterium]
MFLSKQELLKFFYESGEDIIVEETPQNKLALPASSYKPALEHPAFSCQTLEELKKAVEAFEECSIKHTATNLVFADGNPKAKIMLVGEAPGADE